MRVVGVLLALAGVALADPVADAADKALAAFRAKADLKELAAADDPDPWLVADELCARGEHDAAEAFAKAAPRKDVERLPEYVAAQRTTSADVAARAALATANEALTARDYAHALKAIDDAPAADDDRIIAVRLAYGRGVSLRELSRLDDSLHSFRTAAKGASELGWLARASLAPKPPSGQGMCS